MVWIEMHLMTKWVCPGGSDSKELICNVGDLGSIPGMGRSSGEGNGNPLQYFCLENPMDRGAWWATVHGVTVLDMMEWLSMSMCAHGQTHTHTHTQKQNISSFKERTECYSGMFPPLWVAFLSILFFFSLGSFPLSLPSHHPHACQKPPLISVCFSKLPVSSGNYLISFSVHYFSISISLSSLPLLSPQIPADKDRPVNSDWLFILWLLTLHLPCRHLWSQDMWQLSAVVHEPISDLRMYFSISII